MNESRIEVEAVVESFAQGAMTDYYESGGHAAYDATELRIGAPERFAGRRLVIFHDRELPAESPWRTPGSRLRFKMQESLLTGEDVLFAGAVEDLQGVP
jgi:hypothetical protein